MPEGLAPETAAPRENAYPAPNAALFPARTIRDQVDAWLGAALAEAGERIITGPVRAAGAAEDHAAGLQGFDFAAPRDLRSVLGWVIGQMEAGLVHVSHPRYFGLFNPTPHFPAVCAERITACFNPQLATATTSPFPVALEAFLIRAFARRAGLPDDATGHFTAGGSEANATALICALTEATPGFAQDGVHAFSGKPRLYASAAAHLAWLKIAHQAGLGRSALRLIDTDGKGRMKPAALEAAIIADRAEGCVPVLVASTAGTTGGGMIDPLAECTDVARRHGIWHHVDAAWGGALIVSDAMRFRLRGIEDADSVTIDAHKWLAATMGCGMFLTARQAAPGRSFHAAMDCMPSRDAVHDPYVTSMQWSRRFMGLRVFAGLAAAGWRGYAEPIERAVVIARAIRDALVAEGWVCLNEADLAVLCLRPPHNSPTAQEIAHRVVASGEAWVSAVDFEAESAVRICVTSGMTSGEDVERLLQSLRRAAAKQRPGWDVPSPPPDPPSITGLRLNN